MILLDTHVVAWLYAGQAERLPRKVREVLETGELLVSPIVDLELQYLNEIGRLAEGPGPVLAELGRILGLRRADAPVGQLVDAAMSLAWTRDPFDRLLAAHASAENAPLLTADATIRANLDLAVWDD